MRQSSERKKEVACYKMGPRNALMSGTSKKIAPCVTSNALRVAFDAFAFGDELIMPSRRFQLICEVIGGIISEQTVADTLVGIDTKVTAAIRK